MHSNITIHNYTTKKGVYRERYHYMCSNYRFQRGRPCDSTFKIRKSDIEPHLVAIIKNLLNDENFINEVKNQIIDKTDIKSLEIEKDNYQKQLKLTLDNKKRLENEIDNMPFDVKHRERKITDMNDRLYSLYDVIDEIESKIKDVEMKMTSIEYGKVSLETVINAIKQFDTLYELMTDEEKKQAISGIVKEIQVNEEQVNRNYIKSIKLNFNVSNNDSYEFEVPGDSLVVTDEMLDSYLENTDVELKVDGEIIKPKKKYKVTYKMIKEFIEEKYGFGTHTSYIAEVKRDLGLEMINERMIATPKNPVKHPTQKHRDAIEDALKYIKLI